MVEMSERQRDPKRLSFWRQISVRLYDPDPVQNSHRVTPITMNALNSFLFSIYFYHDRI